VLTVLLFTACSSGQLYINPDIEEHSPEELPLEEPSPEEPLLEDSSPERPSWEVGSVTVVSNGVEYELYTQLVDFIARMTDFELMFGSPIFMSLEELYDRSLLPIVPYADDLHFIVDGDDARGSSFMWFNDDFELVDSGNIWINREYLSFPDEAGRHLLFEDVDSGSIRDSREYLSFPGESGIYFLTIRVIWSCRHDSGEESVYHYSAKIIR
jgi:hypothetical protein